MHRSMTAAGIGAAAMVAWRKVFTPWQRNWGATEEEVTAALPGDELTPPPVDQCTRAITIAAPPEEVWPWLVQMGADRGGFYSYAWMENLFGLRIRNADRILVLHHGRLREQGTHRPRLQLQRFQHQPLSESLFGSWFSPFFGFAQFYLPSNG